MATFRLPNDGNIRQLNRGDRFGELWASKNIDLATSPGKIKLARPTEQVMSASDLSNDQIEAIELFDEKIFALTDNNIYSDDAPYTSFSLASNGVTSAQDMVVFDGQLRISEDTDIARFNGSASFADDWWTSDISGTALTSGVPHVLMVSRASGRDTIAVTDGSRLRYYNSASGHTSFTWDSNLIACSQASGLNTNWIGTYNETSGNAEVISWSVGNDTYTQAYPVNGKAVLSMVVVNNIPIIITERGEIQRFNQAGFTTIATLPMWNQPEFLDGVETGLIQASNIARPVHPKGMVVMGDKILVYVNSDASTGSQNVNGRTPSGLWEVDLSTGSVSHRASANNETVLTSSSPVLVVNDPNSRIYFGGRRNPVDTEAEEGLWREDLTAGVTNHGYFVTTEMHSESVEDTYEKILLAVLQDSSSSCVVKYRAGSSLSLPVVADIDWLDATSFTTTTDLSDVEVGHEVEITIGTNAGRVAHVTEIESSTNTYQVTIDEPLGTAAAKAEVQIDNWLKIDETIDTTDLVQVIKLDKPGTMYQFKVYMTGNNGYPEISRMVVKSKNKLEL